MLKRFWFWWKGYRSGLSYIGRVKRYHSFGNYTVKLVNNQEVVAVLVNNLDHEDINTDMIVTVNYTCGKWYFHVPVYQ